MPCCALRATALSQTTRLSSERASHHRHLASVAVSREAPTPHARVAALSLLPPRAPHVLALLLHCPQALEGACEPVRALHQQSLEERTPPVGLHIATAAAVASQSD